ncbi:MAG: hypothetical protein KA712_15520 [Myxococcales bacterium]|nr:hypothetical protein [Myxococcales bacterium]
MSIGVIMMLAYAACARPEVEGEPDGLVDAGTDAGDAGPSSASWQLVEDQEVNVSVVSQGVKLKGVSVFVREQRSEPNQPGALLWQGVTNDVGDARGRFATSADAPRTYEVVLHRAGFLGPYDEERRRAAYGPFAPSSWVSVEGAALEALVAEFTSTEVR